MKTIAFVCEKGGSGKTTLSTEVWHHFGRLGIPASFYALDGQYEDRSVKVDDPKVAVVDTAGRLDADVRRIIEGANCVVIPTRPSPNDIEPFRRTVELVHELTKVPVVIVVNDSNNYTVSRVFNEWLSGRGWDDEVVFVPHSEAIVQASLHRRSVVGHDPYGKASEAVLRLCDAVCSAARISNQVVREGE